MKKSILIYSLVVFSLATSCQEKRASMPRPHAFPRVELPEKDYIGFYNDYCPMSFEYPKQCKINKKQFFFNDNPDHECWFNLSFDHLNATLFFTYYPMGKNTSLDELVDDAFTMVSKHNTMASSREESRISNANGLEGVLFQIGGPVASPLQYYLTDDEKHFMRASLYYNESSASDSLQVITDYIKEDVLHLIGTTSF